MLTILCTQALTEAMAELTPALERAAGQPLSIAYGTSGGLVSRLKAGDSADIILVAQAPLARLEAEGRVVVGSGIAIARTGLGVSVKAGHSHPDIATAEGFRRAILAASSIAYPDPADGGASGIHFAAVLERLGIAEAMRPRSILVKAGGECGHLAATGEAELAVQMISELLPVKGTELVGPFPPDFQNMLVFAAALTAGDHQAAARAVLTRLRAADCREVFIRTGLEPL